MDVRPTHTRPVWLWAMETGYRAQDHAFLGGSNHERPFGARAFRMTPSSSRSGSLGRSGGGRELHIKLPFELVFWYLFMTQRVSAGSG